MSGYEELNALLLDKAVAYARGIAIPSSATSLALYAGRLGGFHAVTASVSKTCLVRFENASTW